MYVSEVGTHRISVFTKKGAFERCFGRKGVGTGEFIEPRGLALAKGWLLVAESRRVSVLSPGLQEDAVKQARARSRLYTSSVPWPRACGCACDVHVQTCLTLVYARHRS